MAAVRTRLEAIRPGVTGVIVAGIDRAPSAKVTLLCFDASGAPAVIAKVARNEVAEAALVAEHEALSRLWSLSAPAVTGYAPEPLALERIGGRLTMVSTPVRGRPMTARYYTPGHVSDPASVESDFVAAGSWLARFHRETASAEIALGSADITRWRENLVDRYAAEIGWSDAEADLFGAVAARADALADVRLPLCGVHGDFWMGNLLVEGSTVTGVVDWELARSASIPFADVYKFPTSYGFYLDRSHPGGQVPGHEGRHRAADRWRRYGDWSNLVGFGYTWFGDGWFPARVRSFVLGHLAELDVPPAVNSVLFPLFLAEQAMTLDVPAFRDGYRSVIRAFAAERSSAWLWEANASRT